MYRMVCLLTCQLSLIVRRDDQTDLTWEKAVIRPTNRLTRLAAVEQRHQ